MAVIGMNGSSVVDGVLHFNIPGPSDGNLGFYQVNFIEGQVSDTSNNTNAARLQVFTLDITGPTGSLQTPLDQP